MRNARLLSSIERSAYDVFPRKEYPDHQGFLRERQWRWRRSGEHRRIRYLQGPTLTAHKDTQRCSLCATHKEHSADCFALIAMCNSQSPHVLIAAHYSLRSASTGSLRDAAEEGIKPAIKERNMLISTSTKPALSGRLATSGTPNPS